MNSEADLTAKTFLSKEHLSALLTNDMKKENSYLLGPLEYCKTHEEIMEEIRAIEAAINFLDSFGVEVKTEHGFYRSTYEILKDLGEHITT